MNNAFVLSFLILDLFIISTYFCHSASEDTERTRQTVRKIIYKLTQLNASIEVQRKRKSYNTYIHCTRNHFLCLACDVLIHSLVLFYMYVFSFTQKQKHIELIDRKV